MAASKLSVEFAEFIHSSKMELADAFKEFCGQRNPTLWDVCSMVIERPNLGRLKFLNVAEVVLQQVHAGGKPEQYTQYYRHLRWVVDAVKKTNTKVDSFADVFRMANAKSKEAGITKLPQYQTALNYAKEKLGFKVE